VVAQNNPAKANSTDPAVPGVAGTNSQLALDLAKGFGLGTGVGVFGSGDIGVQGTSFSGVGVQGESQAFDAVNGLSHSKEHAGVAGHNDGGGPGIWAIGTPAGYFDGEVTVTHTVTAGGFVANQDATIMGKLTVIKDIILTGADCAEEFDIGVANEIQAGTVMVLDGNGSLRPSDRAYDRRVAGVISGAGDYRPGMILDRRDASQQRMPVALLGKVYCKVDAQYAPVEIGDLLTTSPTPGHAMKASDPSRAFGAVIGKALRSFSGGCGSIPILVALQ
jgi:hypothetical protein